MVVAIDQYADAGLSRLQAPTRDAAALAEVLGDPAVGDFAVQVLGNPSSQELRRAIEDFFADRSRQDLLLMHFAGHGLKDVPGKLHLAATDTRRDRLASTAVSAEFLGSLMMASRAQRVVLLLDCCYAGAFERGMFSRADAEAHVQESFTGLEGTETGRGRAVLTASSAVEYAFEGDRLVAGSAARAQADQGRSGPSLFTGAMVEGLRTGAADRDGDGEIGLRELADYVTDRVRRITTGQTPQLFTFGGQGDVPVGRAPRRAARPAALPAPLAAAVTSAERAHRLWAVTDLAGLAQGTNIPLARTACAALTELARDDSRRVEEAAQQMLTDARPRVATGRVDLGSTAAGVLGAPVRLAVGGPPVVRATLEPVVDPWVRVRHTDEGLVLAVDAHAPGRYTGTLTLRCATGSLSLGITATVKAPGRSRGVRASAPPSPPPSPLPSPGVPPRVVSYRGLLPVFTVGAAVLLLSATTPLYEEDYVWLPFAIDGVSFPIGIAALAGAAVMGLFAVLAGARSRVLRHRGLRLPYELIAVASALLASALGTVVVEPYEEYARVGYVLYAAGVVLQLLGAALLWRVRRRRAPRSPGR